MITISTADSKDVDEALDTINISYRSTESSRGWTHELDLLEGDARTSREHLLGITNDARQALLIAKEGKVIVGTVHLRKENDRLYVGLLCVHPNNQDQGIGRLLLQEAENYAVVHGIPRLYMVVLSERQELIDWYQRRGYILTDKKEPFSVDPRFGRPTRDLFVVELEKTIG